MEDESMPMSIKIAFFVAIMVWVILCVSLCYFCHLLLFGSNSDSIPGPPVTNVYDREAGLMRVTVFNTPLRNLMPDSDWDEGYEDAAAVPASV